MAANARGPGDLGLGFGLPASIFEGRGLIGSEAWIGFAKRVGRLSDVKSGAKVRFCMVVGCQRRGGMRIKKLRGAKNDVGAVGSTDFNSSEVRQLTNPGPVPSSSLEILID